MYGFGLRPRVGKKKTRLYEAKYFVKNPKFETGNFTRYMSVLESSQSIVREIIKGMKDVDLKKPICVTVKNKDVYAKLGL